MSWIELNKLNNIIIYLVKIYNLKNKLYYLIFKSYIFYLIDNDINRIIIILSNNFVRTTLDFRFKRKIYPSTRDWSKLD